jgi:hypothetical protein
MKRTIITLFVFTIINAAKAQNPAPTGGGDNTIITNIETNLVLSPGEKLFQEEAAHVFGQFLRILQGVPKGRFKMSAIDNFIDRRFTKDAYIEIEQSGRYEKRSPREYFSNLIGRYYKTKIDSTSEIICKTRLDPRLVMSHGQRQFICTFTQYMIDRKNGQRVGAIDTTGKEVKIIFDPANRTPAAQIKNVTVIR